MLCKGSVVEQNRKRSCWLPAEPFNSFQLCRRCYFQHVTSILDTLTKNYREGTSNSVFEPLLHQRAFLQECFHPAREQAFLNLLHTLFQTKKELFHEVVQLCKQNPLFPIVLTKRIQQHLPGTRCQMYRVFLKDETTYTAYHLCWNCWPCVAWSLKQNNQRLLEMYNSFPLYFSRINLDSFHQAGHRVFLDLCVSQHLLGKDHHIRVLLQHFLIHFPLEEYKSFLLGFLSQPVFLRILFEQKEKDFLPFAFQDAIVLQGLKKGVKESIKRTLYMYKEELMEKTWHPRRLFPWCFDIEEWKEFGVSSADCTEVYRGE